MHDGCWLIFFVCLLFFAFCSFIFIFTFFERVSLCSSGCPRISSVDQAGLSLPASASLVTPYIFFFKDYLTKYWVSVRPFHNSVRPFHNSYFVWYDSNPFPLPLPSLLQGSFVTWLYYVYYLWGCVCMYGHLCDHVWKSEDNLWESKDSLWGSPSYGS